MITRLFGGYIRYGRFPDGTQVFMRFLTLKGALEYGTKGLSAIDPYARYLGNDIQFVPGLIIRRK